MAPEVFSSNEAGFDTDAWAVGTVLSLLFKGNMVYTISGRPPRSMRELT